MINKKGAMFGLDARIALAIFGALSVISGAALYSAIQESKLIVINSYFAELLKASDAYYLDNSEPIPNSSITDGYVSDIIDNRNSLTTWKGPYFDNIYKIADSVAGVRSSVFLSTTNFAIYLKYFKGSNWASSYETCTANDSNCNEYFMINGSGTTRKDFIDSIVTKIDERFDGADGALSGNIRWHSPSSSVTNLYYKGRSRKI